MKTKEELNALKEEVEALSKKLRALSDEEMKFVTGGIGESVIYVRCCRACGYIYDRWEEIWGAEHQVVQPPPFCLNCYTEGNIITTTEEIYNRRFRR